MIYVSLGFLCDSRTHIQNHYGLNKNNGYLTCPFDLMMSNYKGVIDCINDNFKYFCDLEYIELKEIHSIIDELWIYNKKYKFLFNHESPEHADLYIKQGWTNGKNHFIINNFEEFIKRYERRINNFRNYLNSGSHIVFIIYRYNNNLDDLNELYNTIHNNYPNLSFEFKLLQDTNHERIYCHQLMFGFNDEDLYNEQNRFLNTHKFNYLHNDFNPNIFTNFQEENKNLIDNDLKIRYLCYTLFSENSNKNLIYSLKSFYQKYENFDYNLFCKLNNKEVKNLTEEEIIIYWYNNYYKKNKDLKILVAPHYYFCTNNGGVVVQYYLAKILYTLGVFVRITNNTHLEENNIFNKIYNDDFKIEDCIVIYCEGIRGNPLNAPKVVRWMLSPLGKNVPESIINSWGKNELVYYFNEELHFIKDKIGEIYKILNCPYIDSNIINYNKNERNSNCYCYRKSRYHNRINIMHSQNDFEITEYHTQKDYIDILNKNRYFYLYDPLCFLMVISIMCGCICIIHPVEGLSKLEWLNTTLFSNYLKEKNIDNIFGIAYGIEDISYAESTIHLANEQIKDLEQSFFEKSIKPFINDMLEFEKMSNILEKNYDLSKY
jgi:hypothetical protein